MTVTILRTDGTREEHDIGRRIAIRWIERMIGASMLDGVSLRNGLVMFVDDAGWETETIDHGNGRIELRPVKARRPINADATKLYHAVCQPGTTHQIVGDVAIVRDEDFA